ncbi:MAG: hypothetical protein WD016_03495 [Balneolaceae bacterium]
MKATLITIGLAFFAGIIYTSLIIPDSIYILGMHSYLFLAISSALSAFVARFSTKIRSEKVILLTLAGLLIVIISPILFNAVLLGENLRQEIIKETFITLFFAGHAAMIGAFAASVFRKMKMRNAFQRLPAKSRSKGFYRNSVPEEYKNRRPRHNYSLSE